MMRPAAARLPDLVTVAGGPWRPAGTAVASALAACGLALVGLGTGRADLVVIAGPVLMGLVWSWMSRPHEPSRFSVTVPQRAAATGRVTSTINIDPAAGSAMALLRLAAPDHRATDVVIDSSVAREIDVSIAGTRTGRQPVFSVAHQEAGADRLVRSDGRTAGPVRATVLPVAHPLGRLPLPPRLQGMTGSHGSRRVGDGGDLHDVAPFAAGSRLRRIDWRVTLRESGRGAGAAGAAGATGAAGAVTDLFVRRTLATADAVITLVLDSRDEVGPDTTTWSGMGALHPGDPTSLDIARHAAASIAAGYLEAGDRVGFVDLAGTRVPVRPAGGQRHLQRVVHALAEATPAGDARPIQRPPQIPSGAMVVVLSTFLDDEPTTVAVQWARHGHRVFAVDVLPPVEVGHLGIAERNAHRIIEIERQDRIAELVRGGVEVVEWTPSVDDLTTLAVSLQVAAVARPRRR
ncbi:MAG: DUF58 domain-containing protein [Nitriliruptoraceae bacterium]